MVWIYVALALVGFYYVYNWWRHRSWVHGLHSKAVFITGCDTGFGNAAARSLYGRGVYVFAGCYTESGAAKLRQETGDRLNTLILDVTSSTSIQEAYRYVTANLPAGIEFWGLVNNAGIGGVYTQLEFYKLEDFHKVFAVNFFGMIEMTQTFLPLLKASKGRLVNVASMAAEIPCPGFIPYGSSKWAVKGFTESLRLEKAVWGIKVSTVEPGGFKTGFDMLNPDLIRSEITRLWEQADATTRHQYGETYRDEVIDEIISKNEQYASHDLSPVVRAYEDALFSASPRAVYTPGVMLLTLLPSSIAATLLMTKAIPHVLKR